MTNEVGNVRARAVVRALVGAAVLLVALAWALDVAGDPGASSAAAEEEPTLLGGEGTGVSVAGHTDLGGEGLNGHLSVHEGHAYVGFGTNGGFASQWNKTPRCQTGSVKVADLEAAEPEVVAEIALGDQKMMARTVDVLAVEDRSGDNDFTGDLLAVGVEKCNDSNTGTLPGTVEPGAAQVRYYDVSDPSSPALLGVDDSTVGTFQIGPREVSLVQREDGRVLSLSATQGTGQDGGVHVTDVTDPRTPQRVGEAPHEHFNAWGRGCRPYMWVQGVSSNAAGTQAYVAHDDYGLLQMDIADLPEPPAEPADLTERIDTRTEYDEDTEGGSFRFRPNDDETVALATDEDLHPGETTLTVTDSSAADVAEPGGDEGVFRACEAIWGGPMYQQDDASLDDVEVVFVGGRPQPGGDEDGDDEEDDGVPIDDPLGDDDSDGGDGRGCDEGDYDGVDAAGKIVVVFRGCTYNEGAEIAQEQGAVAYVVANTQENLFAPDALADGDAGIDIPVAMIGSEAGHAIADAHEAGEQIEATLADEADTWGALRVFDLSGDAPAQTAVHHAPGTTELPHDEGLYHAVNPVWSGDDALVAWMSDGLRVVDLSDPTAPVARAHYTPPATSDPTDNYAEQPHVVDVAEHGDQVVASDINGGLYVLDVARSVADCLDGGWQGYAGFDDQADCEALFTAVDDDPEDPDDVDDPEDVDDDVEDATDALGEVSRLAGASRVQTAVEISRRRFADGGADTVLLARGDVYADALAGAPLAVQRGAPLLLSFPDALHDDTAAEIDRLGVDRAVLLGGAAALSPQVAADLEARGVTVERAAGEDRFATAAAIAQRLDATGSAVIAEGAHADPDRGWPDALAASPLAAHTGRPVLLVTHARLPEATARALGELDATETVVAGGEAAVSDAVLAELDERGHGPRRVSGRTRYETAAAIRDEAVDAGMDPDRLWLATGRQWPDALSAGPAVAGAGATLMLVDGQDLGGSPPVGAVLDERADSLAEIVLLGGGAAITPQAEDDIRDRVNTGE